MISRKNFLISCSILVLFYSILTPVNAEEKNSFLKILQFEKGSLAQAQKGEKLITIVMRADEFSQMFPIDPAKRSKSDHNVLITDGKCKFLAVLSPGGQSTLKGSIPNLRIKDIEEIVPENGSKNKDPKVALAGVPIIDGTIRFNPMTMDDGYVNTLTYIEFLNHFNLIPVSAIPLSGEFAKVDYRFVDNKNQWTAAVNPADGKKIEVMHAGLHLVNFHPVKYLKSIKTDGLEVEAVARSRYNILNTLDKVRNFFGKPGHEDSEEIFSSTDVKNESTAPFRVQVQWARKTKAEKEGTGSAKANENLGLLKELLAKAYSAPKKFHGRQLYDELNKAMDLQQMFRFMALNRVIENGDISDEFFWYAAKNLRQGEARLGIMPQDGDDMFKGAHNFPFSPKQIGLMVNSSALAKKLGLEFGYIMNFEDPLFRIVQDDAFLFLKYLEAFDKIAGELAGDETLNRTIGRIAAKLKPYSVDPEVLFRGKTDERGKEYTSTSFGDAVLSLRKRIKANAEKALASLRKSQGKPGDLEKTRKAAAEE